MRPGQQNKRGRGRGSNNNSGGGNFNRKGGNPLSRTYDSSGPDVKIRGTAQHIAEKYSNLARDAQSAGDRVIAENYLQHAEHYNRIIAAAQAQMQERFQSQDRGSDYQDRDGNGADQDDIDTNDGDDEAYGQQPSGDEGAQQPRREQPQHVGNHGSGQQQPRENRREREPRRDRRQDREPRREQPGSEDQPNVGGQGGQAERQTAEKPAADHVAAQPAQSQSAPMQLDRAQAAQAQPETEKPVTTPARAPRASASRAARPAANPAADDGSGPQPVIEGMPAEVAAEQGEQPEAAVPRAPRRRAAARPRRQPRKTADGEAASEDTKPDMVDVAGK